MTSNSPEVLCPHGAAIRETLAGSRCGHEKKTVQRDIPNRKRHSSSNRLHDLLMSNMAIQKRNAKTRSRGWVVLFFVISFVLGNLLHSQLPVTGFAQANEAYASSVDQGAAMQMKIHLPGRHGPDGELPGQAHNQFANCAAADGCSLCGPVQTMDAARPNTLLMPAAPARQDGISSRTSAPPLRPPIFQA